LSDDGETGFSAEQSRSSLVNRRDRCGVSTPED
jgi:hypothetical protein